MKKYFFSLFFLVPVVIFASTREADEIERFRSYVQPVPSISVNQDGIKATYQKDEQKLTDTIMYTNWNKTWKTPGPWSIASDTRRKVVRKCMKDSGLSPSGCWFYEYKILRLSPSGKYIELVWEGWESVIWRMLDTKTGKIVLSNDNGVSKSMWTQDKKQFIWQTGDCSIGWCTDPAWTFITVLNQFPKYKKVQE